MTTNMYHYPIDIQWDTFRIGETIRELRNSLNLSQQILAEMIGVDVKTIGRWERGDIDFAGVPVGKVVLLAVALNADVKTILNYPG